MARMISGREIKHYNDYRVEFTDKAYSDDRGYTFNADENFNVVPEQKAYYEQLLGCENYDGPHKVTYVREYIENAKAICECGKKIEIYDQYEGACECPHCHRWHNLYGSEIRKPQYWLEDLCV